MESGRPNSKPKKFINLTFFPNLHPPPPKKTTTQTKKQSTLTTTHNPTLINPTHNPSSSPPTKKTPHSFHANFSLFSRPVDPARICAFGYKRPLASGNNDRSPVPKKKKNLLASSTLELHTVKFQGDICHKIMGIGKWDDCNYHGSFRTMASFWGYPFVQFRGKNGIEGHVNPNVRPS